MNGNTGHEAFYTIQIQQPKNGKPGAICVSDDWQTKEAVVEVGDDAEAIGRKIAALLRQCEQGA